MSSLIVFTLLHPLVDCASASLLWLTAEGWSSFFVYAFCAFALQLPLGFVLDTFPRWTRPAFGVGVGLVALACLTGVFLLPGLVMVGVCCLGNALFHLSAGKLVLDRTDGRSGPIGLFISTGALGLFAASHFVVDNSSAMVAPVAFALLAGGAMACRFVDFSVARQGCWRPRWGLPLAAVAGLFALVAWRGWVALSACSASDAFAVLLAGAVVTWAGKVVGGYLAECVGLAIVVAVSVCGSLLLCLGVGTASVAGWLAIVFLAQLATGPVLTLVYRCVNRSSGVAFGINCLGLFAGSL